RPDCARSQAKCLPPAPLPRIRFSNRSAPGMSALLVRTFNREPFRVVEAQLSALRLAARCNRSASVRRSFDLWRRLDWGMRRADGPARPESWARAEKRGAI